MSQTAFSSLKDFVKDWGGFEKLVADMNQTGSVKVEHNVKLVGMSGVPRQVDVLITHQQGLYEYKIIGECKFWKQKIKRTHVDAMITAIRDLGASKGVFFTTKGFQSGAKEIAEKSGIDLFLIRELTDEEWGLPGRHIHLYLHFITRTIFNLQISNSLQAIVLDQEIFAKHGPQINIELGNDKNKNSKTKIAKDDGAITTLEEILDIKTLDVLNTIFEKPFLFNNGTKGTYYIQQRINIKSQRPIKVLLPGAIILLPEIKFDLGIKIEQSEFNMDRMTPYTYALAVEDCVRNKLFSATKKRTDASEVIQTEIGIDQAVKSREDVLVNGSIIRVNLKGWFDPKELANLKVVPMKKTALKNKI